MITKILNRPVTVLMACVCLIGLALFSLMALPVELNPDADFPQLSLQIAWSNASSEMVERSITTLAEQAAATVNRVKKITSTSSEGLAHLEISFQKNTDMDLARLELSEKIAALNTVLPHDAKAGLIQNYIPKEFAGMQGFISYRLYGRSGLAFLQRYGQEIIRPALMAVNGVASVDIRGGARREIALLLDEDRLHSMNIGLDQVMRAIRQASFLRPVGDADQNGIGQNITIGDGLYQVHELKKVWLANRNNKQRPLALEEFCRVKDTLAEAESIVRINGQPAVTVEIDKEPGINMLKTARAIDAVVERLQSAFPPDIALEKVMDRSTDIRSEINELAGKSLSSVLLVIIILLLFFRSLRSSIIVLLSVFFSTACAVIYLALSGIGLNVITLSALALSVGVIVDNAVVIFENIQRQLAAAPALSIRDNIEWGTVEMRLPLLAATATTIGALVPVVFLPENLRAFFIQFAWTTAVALAFSYWVAITFIPTACLWFFDPAYILQKRFASPAWLAHKTNAPQVIFKKALLWNLHHRKTVLFISLLFVGLPFWLLPPALPVNPVQPAPADQHHLQQIKNNMAEIYNLIMDNGFMRIARPYFDHLSGGASHLFFKYVYKGELWKLGFDTYVIVYAEAPQGTELKRLDEYGRRFEELLAKNRQVVLRYASQINSRSVYLRVDFDRQTGRTAVPLVIKDQLTALAAGTSGFTVSVAGFGPGFYSGGGMNSNYTLQILGYNYNKVKEIARNISSMLALNARVTDIQIDRLPWQTEEYELVGRIDRSALHRHGIGLDEFLASLAVKLRRGIQRQRVVIGQEEVDFSLMLKPGLFAGTAAYGAGDENVSSLLASQLLAGDKMVRIGDVLSVELQPLMAEIKRESQQYTRFISYNFMGPSRLGNRYLESVLASVPLPVGYEVKRPDYAFFLGKKQALPMLLMAVVSILIVFMITASLFESLRKPLSIILSVPMSLIGLFLGFYLFDVNFGRGGYAALILLIGLSVNNGILLVSRMARLTQGATREASQCIIEAVVQRSRPILITTFTTVAGFLPFVIGGDPCSFWYSFAFAVICGLLTSTAMILLVIPVLYVTIGGG